MKCKVCREYVEGGVDVFGRCRVCRKAEMTGGDAA